MELKFIKRDGFLSYIDGSNRTFMELKFRRSHLSQHLLAVLIVPLWN